MAHTYPFTFMASVLCMKYVWSMCGFFCGERGALLGGVTNFRGEGVEAHTAPESSRGAVTH